MSASGLYTACIIGFCLTAAVIIGAVVSGGSFGARCERMHPGDALAQERCIFDLSRGQRP